MKKMFTVDAFMVAIISALGYGFGEIIARLSGWPKLMCGVASLVLGVTLESIISKIIFFTFRPEIQISIIIKDQLQRTAYIFCIQYTHYLQVIFNLRAASAFDNPLCSRACLRFSMFNCVCI